MQVQISQLRGLLEQHLSEQYLEEATKCLESLTQDAIKFETKQDGGSEVKRRDIDLEQKDQTIEFLQKKLQDTLTEREDVTIQLKSEVIVYKEKAKQYKAQMQKQKAYHDTEAETLLNEKVTSAKHQYVQEMSDIQTENVSLKSRLEEAEKDKQDLTNRLNDFEKGFMDLAREKDDKIKLQEDQLNNYHSKYDRKLVKEKGKYDQIKRTLQTEEKSRELYSLKLDQVIVNNKKLMLQKKFLEKQIEKDLREIQLEMNKIQIEIQQEGSTHMLGRFREVYQTVMDQMNYTQQIVGFMDFDQEAATSGMNQQVQSYDEVVQEINDNCHKVEKLISDESKSNTNVTNMRSILPITEEEVLGAYPIETIMSLLRLNIDMLTLSNVQPNTMLTKLLEELVELNPNMQAPVVKEIHDRYFHQSLQRYQQHLLVQQDKMKQLEVNNKNLSLRVQRAKLDLKRSDEGRPTQERKMSTEEKIGEGLENYEEDQLDDVPDVGGGSTSKNLPEPADTPNERTFQSPIEGEPAKIVDALRQENLALKERCKEIRLNLQRKITELQDTLTISKQKYLTELSELKVQYGADLARITKNAKEDFEIERQALLNTNKKEIEDLKAEQVAKEKQLRQEIAETERRAKEKEDQSNQRVKEAEKELKKIQNESTGYSQGGWGTFIVAFEIPAPTIAQDQIEDGPNATNLSKVSSAKNEKISLKKPFMKSSTRGNQSADADKTSEIPLPRKESNPSELTSTSHIFALEEEDDGMPHTFDKIAHFIEVGFLIDENNFRLLNKQVEQTFDSHLKKYVYELQDPLSNYQMNNLQAKIRQQLADNVGLFNEIGPVYISLNMGRPSTPTNEDYQTQEKFRLVKREGLQLNNRFFMINFLKCDAQLMINDQNTTIMIDQQNDSSVHNETQELRAQQEYVLRLIAFEDATSAQFNLDLNFHDLLTFTDGNLKLLEDENIHDLCILIMNNLTMIRKESKLPDKKGHSQFEDVLIVENRMFFNDDHRQVYDRKSKSILGKYDKKRLLRDVALVTEFEKSVLYEAFVVVYEEVIQIKDETLSIEVVKGKQSGNVKLRVVSDTFEKELCFFLERMQKSHKLCSEIIHQTDENQKTLAYIISIEKLYGTDEILVVRLVLIEKANPVMSEYQLEPDSLPRFGTTSFSSETLYLVQKNDRTYCRIDEFEILNTEIRTLLFMHSYGYLQANQDFGNIRRYLEQGEQRRLSYLSVIGEDDPLSLADAINTNIQEPAAKITYKGANQMVFQQFSTVRFKTQEALNTESNSPRLDNEVQMVTGGQDLQPTTNHYALVSIYEDGHCLEYNQIVIKVVIQSLDIDVIQKVTVPRDVMNNKKMMKIADIQIPEQEKFQICETLIDRLFVLDLVRLRGQSEIDNMDQISEINEDKEVHNISLYLDKDQPPMSDLISQEKQKRFEETLRQQDGREDDHELRLELPKLQLDALKVSLTKLAECNKVSQTTLINQTQYKVNAYFVQNQRGFEPCIQAEHRLFQWHFIYIELAQRSMDQHIVFSVTEADLLSLVNKLKQKLRVSGQTLDVELIRKGMPQEQILDFVLDCLIMDVPPGADDVVDVKKFKIRLSMIHLRQRFIERQRLKQSYLVNGGRFINMLGGQDPELVGFETSLPYTEYKVKLLQNIQKDMSDKTFDVKIYEIEFKCVPGSKKIRFEIFWIEQPNIVFRCDLLSEKDQEGSHMIIERVNIIEHIEFLKMQKGSMSSDQLDPNKFAKDGLVLALHESAFPHQISFMLIEPCSHIQWEYNYFDDKINVIESRKQRQNFVGFLQESLAEGVLRDIDDKLRAARIEQIGSQQLFSDQLHKKIFYHTSRLENIMQAERNSPVLLYSKALEVKAGIFRNLRISSDYEADKFIMTLELPQEDIKLIEELKNKNSAAKVPLYKYEVQASLKSQREGSRVIAGCMPLMSSGTDLDGLPSHEKNLIYTIEIVCAIERKEKAVRVSIFNQLDKSPLISIIFIDKSIFTNERELLMGEMTSFGLRSGFTDSLAVISKMACLNFDFGKHEMDVEFRVKLEDNRSVDIQKDYKQILSANLIKQQPKKSKEMGEFVQSTEGKSLQMSTEKMIKSKEQDKTFYTLSQLKQAMINKSLKNNELVFRKIMLLDKGKTNIVITVLRCDNPLAQQDENAPKLEQYKKYLLKVVIAENKREQQELNATQKCKDHVFVFNYNEVFTYDEMMKCDLFDLSVLRQQVTSAVNTRLRVKKISDQLSIDTQDNYRFIAFFLDKSPLPMDLPSQKLFEMNQNMVTGLKDFDIRQLHSFDLLEPENKVLPTIDRRRQEQSMLKQSLIYQFEKDDLMFDVFEIHNPQEQMMRFKVYDKETFRMLTSCEIGEARLKEQLAQDKRSYLSQPQQRDQLARYVIDNSYYDEQSRSLRFMVSDLIEDV